MPFATQLGFAGPLDAITEGPHWPVWPERWVRGVANLITAPTVQGGQIGGIGNVANNLASMIKRMDNMRRAASRSGARLSNLQLIASYHDGGRMTYRPA